MPDQLVIRGLNVEISDRAKRILGIAERILRGMTALAFSAGILTFLGATAKEATQNAAFTAPGFVALGVLPDSCAGFLRALLNKPESFLYSDKFSAVQKFSMFAGVLFLFVQTFDLSGQDENAVAKKIAFGLFGLHTLIDFFCAIVPISQATTIAKSLKLLVEQLLSASLGLAGVGKFAEIQKAVLRNPTSTSNEKKAAELILYGTVIGFAIGLSCRFVLATVNLFILHCTRPMDAAEGKPLLSSTTTTAGSTTVPMPGEGEKRPDGAHFFGNTAKTETTATAATGTLQPNA